MTKNEKHIVQYSREVDAQLAIALGEMVIALGRIEDMFKVAIKRLDRPQRTLEEVIEHFSGSNGTLNSLIEYCDDPNAYPQIVACCTKAKIVNVKRQDFIHATFAIENGEHIRFRKLIGYTNLQKDIEEIRQITDDVYALIDELDAATGAPLSEPAGEGTMVTAASTERR